MRSQYVGNVMIREFLIMKVTGNKLSHHPREGWLARSYRQGWPKKPCASDAGHGTTGFNVYPSGFQSCFGPKPPLPFLPFGMGMCILCLCILKIFHLFWILQGLIAKNLP
jgi:hypothetical protein